MKDFIDINKTVDTAVFCAGQAGAMMLRMLPARFRVLSFVDSDEKKQGTSFMGLPVLSMKETLERGPECIIVATMNKDAEKEIKEGLRKAGYEGEIRSAGCMRENLDIRLAAVRMIAEQIRERKIGGACAELGVYRGDLAAEINRELPDRKLYLFDTFSGFDERDIKKEKTGFHSSDFKDTGEDLVKSRLPHSENAVFVKGRFPESLGFVREQKELRFCLVSLDPDLYEPVIKGLEYFYPRLEKGGAIILHDYNSMQFEGVGRAAGEFCQKHGLYPVPLCDFHGTAVIRKQ